MKCLKPDDNGVGTQVFAVFVALILIGATLFVFTDIGKDMFEGGSSDGDTDTDDATTPRTATFTVDAILHTAGYENQPEIDEVDYDINYGDSLFMNEELSTYYESWPGKLMFKLYINDTLEASQQTSFDFEISTQDWITEHSIDPKEHHVSLSADVMPGDDYRIVVEMDITDRTATDTWSETGTI